jgi:hypothetical protein
MAGERHGMCELALRGPPVGFISTPEDRRVEQATETLCLNCYFVIDKIQKIKK